MVMIMVVTTTLGTPLSWLTGGILEHDVFGNEKENAIHYKTACGLSLNGILVPMLTALQMTWLWNLLVSLTTAPSFSSI
jgi:hypothetical protein